MKCNGINLGHICSSSKENAYQLLVAAGGLGKKGLGPVQAQWESVLGSISDVCLGMGGGSSGTCADMGLGSHRCQQINFPYEDAPFCLGHRQDLIT